ncbi:MAG: pilus assembly protein CpaE [Pseudomonadota bacterium]
MKNALNKALDIDDDQGKADEAAVLGADGGPAQTVTSTDLALLEDDLDDDWLDEELSDEELAVLGEEDFEAAFSDDDEIDEDEDEDGFVSGDLDDYDDLDEFELLEAPAAQPPHTAPPAADRTRPEMPPIADSADGEFGDDIFDIGEAEDEDVSSAAASQADVPPMADSRSDNEASIDDDLFGDGTTDRFEAADDYSSNAYSSQDDFNSDPDFSIDDDLSTDSGDEVSLGAVVVKGRSSEIKSRDKGDVASPKDLDPDADTSKVEPELADDQEDGFSEFDDEDDDTHHRPVPRISIHAFCETSRNSTILERAAVDRRLAKAHFTMHMGGIEKAVDLYQSGSTPNLIILETVNGGMQLIQQLGHLAEVCDPSTKVVVIGRVNDIRLYRELIRQGISEYIVRPQSPLQIIKAISELYVDPSAPPIGKTVAFVGARGGVGSSTLAHNVGYSFAEDFKSDTVILDLDLPFGTAALDFDHEPTSGLMEALTSPERLDDVLLERLLQKHTDHLSLFTAPNMLDRDYDIDDDAYDTVIDIVRGTAPTVVIDVPHNWTGWSKKILQTADEIVITATPDFASFRNMKYLMEVIGSSRPNDSKPYFIYNQFDPKTSAVPVEYFVENIDLEPSLVLGWEPQLFNQAATNAAPIMETSPKSKVAQGLNELSGKILGRTQTLALPSRFSLTSLFKRK